MDIMTIASHILHGVGFKENIESLTYCATRLRFILKDDHLIDDVLVDRLGVVKNTFRTRGQYHVVIGLEHTKEIYEQVKSLLENDVIHTREFDIANRILQGIQGPENLISISYCATRLRIEVHHLDQIDDEGICELEEVKKSFFTQGQYQVVLNSQQVKQVYESLVTQVNQPVLNEKRTYGRFKTR